MLKINHLSGFSGSSFAPYYEFIYHEYHSTAGDVTLSNLGIGPATRNRTVLVAVTWYNGVPPGSCTIGGITATKVVTAEGASYTKCCIYAAAVPDGTTATVYVQSPAAQYNDTTIGVYVLHNLESSTPVDTHEDITTGGGTISKNVPAGGIVILSALGYTNTLYGVDLDSHKNHATASASLFGDVASNQYTVDTTTDIGRIATTGYNAYCFVIYR